MCSCNKAALHAAAAGLAAVTILMVKPVNAQLTPVDWTTPTSGNLAGVSVTMSNLSPEGILNRSYTSADFSAAPMVSAEAIEYAATDDWTATFSQPVSGLLLYVDAWRGAYTSNPDPPTSYTFDQPFTILSGLGDASVIGNTLMLPGTRFHDGIIRFAGPISALSVDSQGGSFDFGQGLTFAVSSPVGIIPEPGTCALLASGLLPLVGMVLRNRRKG